MEYDNISSSAQSELSSVVENIVTTNEVKFVEYLNNARPLTPRIHALELIPGIGKTFLNLTVVPPLSGVEFFKGLNEV